MTHLGDPNGLELVSLHNGGKALRRAVALLGKRVHILGQVEVVQPRVQPTFTHGQFRGGRVEGREGGRVGRKFRVHPPASKKGNAKWHA